MARNTRQKYSSANPSENSQGSLRIHESGSISTAQDFTYVGFAAEPGTLDNQECWRIARIEESGSFTLLTHPSGSDAYIYRWDDRLSFSYS